MADDSQFLMWSLVAFSATKHYLSYILTKTRYGKEKQLDLVGHVASLRIYPLKSGGAIYAQSLKVDSDGIFCLGDVHDRYMVIAKENGEFVTAKQYPKMLLISPSIHDNHVHFDAPAMETLKIPLAVSSINKPLVMCRIWDDIDIPSIDCGKMASDWISAYLNKTGLRMFTSTRQLPKRDMKKGDTVYHQQSPDGTHLVFHGASPCHLLSEESVADLNTRLTKSVNTENFRPNIVVSGTRPYEEFDWRDILIGNVAYSYLFPCERCTIPSINPKTAERDPKYQPFTTLKSYMPYGIANVGPTLGIQLKPSSVGVVRVGDPVYVLRRTAPSFADSHK